jgi:transcriptional regulator with GAF, ATPase, and Fis domain
MAPPDWVNVDRALTGERVALNVAERRAVIAALTERRCSAAGIARRLGMHQRSVVRVRARIRAEGRERTDAAA